MEMGKHWSCNFSVLTCLADVLFVARCLGHGYSFASFSLPWGRRWHLPVRRLRHHLLRLTMNPLPVCARSRLVSRAGCSWICQPYTLITSLLPPFPQCRGISKSLLEVSFSLSLQFLLMMFVSTFISGSRAYAFEIQKPRRNVFICWCLPCYTSSLRMSRDKVFPWMGWEGEGGWERRE